MFEDFTTLSDIKDFHEKLKTEFITRSLIKIFRTKDVQPPKKQQNVSQSDITENKKKGSDKKSPNSSKEFSKNQF